MAHADVVIVGAGLAGCSVAWHLAPHARVLLLEQAEQPGAEASSQNAGMIRRLGEDPYERALALRTHAWLEDPGEDWADLAVSRVTGAVLALAHDRYHLHDAAAHLRALGVAIESTDRPAEVAPALTGSPVPFAWVMPEERVADAHAVLTGFLRGLRRHGGEVRPRTEVVGLLVQGGRVAGVQTAAGPIPAGRVVLAAGAWSAALARTAGLRRPLIPVRRTLLQTAPHSLSAPDHPWTWVDDVGIYVRPETGGWLCSPCDEAVEPPPPGPGSRGPVEPEPRALAADKLERWLPAVADIRFTGGWTGLRTFAPDRRPFLGADPDLEGLWWAAGLGGFGVTCSYATGEVVAAWMRGQTVPWMHAPSVSPGRPLPTRWALRPTGSLDATRLEDVGLPDPTAARSSTSAAAAASATRR